MTPRSLTPAARCGWTRRQCCNVFCRSTTRIHGLQLFGNYYRLTTFWHSSYTNENKTDHVWTYWHIFLIHGTVKMAYLSRLSATGINFLSASSGKRCTHGWGSRSSCLLCIIPKQMGWASIQTKPSYKHSIFMSNRIKMVGCGLAPRLIWLDEYD